MKISQKTLWKYCYLDKKTNQVKEFLALLAPLERCTINDSTLMLYQAASYLLLKFRYLTISLRQFYIGKIIH